MMSLRRLSTTVSLACALGAAACSDAPSTEQCQQLLDHIIDLEITGGAGGAQLSDDMKKDLEKQRKQVVDYALQQKTFMETCTEKTPKKVVVCALAAKTEDDLVKCDDSSAK